MEAIKEYGFNKKQINQSYIMSAIMLLGGLVLSVIIKRLALMPIIFGIVSLVIGTLNSKHKIIKFFDKHIEIKKALVSSVTLIKNEQLVKIEENKNKLLIHYKTGDNVKTSTLLIKVLEKNEYDEIIALLKERLSS